MAEPLTRKQLLGILEDPAQVGRNPFRVLHAVNQHVGSATDAVHESRARDLVIRLLEHREQLSDRYEPVLSALARRVGLYPYADHEVLTFADALALEAHRPLGHEVDDLVFHEAQGWIYRLLISGENVILSAPTSFGKSLVIDAVIATRDYRNCAVVVPTIALLDETRRRLASRFGDRYKVITHGSQRLGDQNLFVMTQERLLDYPDLPDIDFFAIDEFYKLDLRMDPDRAALLNQALYKLWKGGGQFYLLGPNIEHLPRGLELDARFIQTDFKTVALDVQRVGRQPDESRALVEICRELHDSTIIYCRSPNRTREVAELLLGTEVGKSSRTLDDVAAWIEDNFDRDWLVARALRRGIGIHHGRLPRALAHLIVRLFNEGHLLFLICTSTMIEGVNTAAKNVVIFDNKVATKKFDFFTFNNIRGRSGRMFKHFIGRVFLFYNEPIEELPFVDLPVFTQTEDTPPELLLQLDDEDLTPLSRQRLRPYLEQDVLDPDVLRANPGIDLEGQLRLARDLDRDPHRYLSNLVWNQYPLYEQLEATCTLIWEYLRSPAVRSSVRSARQLAFLLNKLRELKGQLRFLIIDQRRPEKVPDDTVEDVLDFVRQWPGHHFPRLLLALQRIEEAVFARHGLPAGDYRFYANRVENLFLPPFALALEEYGIPVQLAVRLPGVLGPTASLDDVLNGLRALDVSAMQLTPFEEHVILDARRGL